MIEGSAVPSVLVLNASYEPLNVVSVRRAVVLLLKDKAELIEAVGAVLRAERVTVPTPSVIRLVAYVRIPYRMRVPVSRRGVLARDRFTCQYCGAVPGRNALTIDHVIPRSRGGPKRWENLVAACARCNRRKGGRLPDEAGMSLRSAPSSPRYVALAFVGNDGGPEVWQKYLQPDSGDR
ncbi:MAG: HNH endonuclease [Anaerolineae bacterium]